MGQSGVVRSSDGVSSSSSRPNAYFLRTFTTRTTQRSPTAVPGTNTGHAICAADAAALGGHGGDLRFKQIIFLYHGKTSVKHKILFFMYKAENMRVI